MEIQKKFCSYQGHEKIISNIYCTFCKVYMCTKCEPFHSKLLPNHKVLNIEKINADDISQELCHQENHNLEFQFYCKDHNKLCCAKCVTKIKNKENGMHKDCDVCTIEEIKNEKMNNLNQNINNLEILSKNFEESINKLKDIFEKINDNKEDIKVRIQKIFTKIRNELNNREDLLLKEVDDIFENKFFGEEIIKKGEKLPNKIKKSLERCKAIGNNIDENKIISLINDCISIEENINEINNINNSINKYNKLVDVKVFFSPNEEDSQLKKLIENINYLGRVFMNNEHFCDSNIIGHDNNKQNMLIKWIEEKIKKVKENLSTKLIFKMSKDGEQSEDFHKCCDNQGPTLILIQTTNNKIFGGFTPLNWKSPDSGSSTITDPSNQTFIFSLDLNKKYNLLNMNKQAIKCSKELGPDFGNDDIQLKKNLKEGMCYADSSCNFIINGGTELTGSKENKDGFVTKELEVFKICY